MFFKKNQALFSALTLIDFLLLNLSISICAYSLNQLWWQPDGFYFFSYAIEFNLFWYLIAFWRNYYSTSLQLNKIVYASIFTFLYFITFTLLTNFAFKQTYVSRLFYFSSISTFFAFIVFSRYVLIYLVEQKKIFNVETNKTILLLNNSLSEQLINTLKESDSNYDLIGYFSDGEHQIPGLNQLGNLTDMFSHADTQDVNHVFSTYLPPNPQAIQAIVSFWERKGAHVNFVPDMKIYFDRPVRITTQKGLPIISMHTEPLEHGFNRLKKRTFDLAFTLLVFILVLWWLVPLIVLAIIITSGFPVFFLQQRTGRDGAIFTCFKFRTMKKNQLADVLQATKNDNRLTLLGRFLRASNFDELPQFLNVLMGDMSVVGPRPHMVKHTEEYRRLIDTYMVRLYLKPGITGLAQVSGLRGELNEDKLRKRVEKDIEYMNNWSLWMDVRIILRTIKLTFRGDPNAY
jgi:putative colanic acid biosynthesis UDP-glucose lipid carrier transferase